MSSLTLYHFPRSSCSRKVVFALTHKGLDYKEVIINLEKGQQKESAFIQLNPYGQVPVLKYQNLTLYDSAVINEFLEEQFPQAPLLPQSPQQRSQIRLATLHADQVFYPHISKILREFRQQPERLNKDWITNQLNDFQASSLSQLETSLQQSSGDFLFEMLTLADIAYAPGLDTLLRVSLMTLDGFPYTAGWFKRICALSAFHKTQPPAANVLRQ